MKVPSSYIVATVSMLIVLLAGGYALISMGRPDKSQTVISSTSSSYSTSSSSSRSSTSTSSSRSADQFFGSSYIVEVFPNAILVVPGGVSDYAIVTITSEIGTPPHPVSPKVPSANGLSANLSEQFVQLPGSEHQFTLVLKADPTTLPGSYQMIIEISTNGGVQDHTFVVMVVPNLVIMNFLQYLPGNLTVRVGSTVVWLNLEAPICDCDPGTHDVTFQSGNVHSLSVARYATFSYTFATTGVFRYYDSLHPSMQGTIVVTGG